MRLKIDIMDRNRSKDTVYEKEYKNCKFEDVKDKLYVVIRDKDDIDITFSFGLGIQTKEKIKDIFTKELIEKNNTEVKCVSVYVDVARMKIRIENNTCDFTGRLENYDFLVG